MNIAKMSLWDVVTKKDIRVLGPQSIVTTAEISRGISFHAEAPGASSVKFTIIQDNASVGSKLEQNEPYVAFGDNVAVSLHEGPAIIQAIPYSDNDGKVPGPTSTLSIVVAKPAPTHFVVKGQCGGTSIPLAKGLSIMNDLHTKAIRTWIDFTYGAKPQASDFDSMRAYKQAGKKVIAVLHNPNLPPSVSVARDTANRLADATVGALDGYEIINEPNLGGYFRGSLTQYINQVLKPFSSVLNSRGLKVYGAAISTEINKVISLDSLGYFDLVDYACFHPYQNNANDAIAVTKQFVKIVNKRKPIALTEWGIHGSWNKPKLTDEQWAAQFQIIFDAINPDVDELYYYRMEQNTQPAGHEGLVTPNTYTPTAFYTPFKNLKGPWKQ